MEIKGGPRASARSSHKNPWRVRLRQGQGSRRSSRQTNPTEHFYSGRGKGLGVLMRTHSQAAQAHVQRHHRAPTISAHACALNPSLQEV